MDSQFQALITGAVMGALLKESIPNGHLLIDVEPVMEGSNFTNKIQVRGKESGERLLVVVMAEAEFPPEHGLGVIEGGKG